MKATLRLVGGMAAFVAGVAVLAALPPTDAARQLAVGWGLMVAGIVIGTSAALDLLGVE